MPTNTTPPIRFAQWRDIMKTAGHSRATNWRLECSSDFPHRKQLGPHAVGWIANEVELWLNSRPDVNAYSESDGVEGFNR